MAYQFTPPQWTYKTVLHGRSLQYSFPVSETVWKDTNSVWHHGQTPPWETVTAALIVYTTPAVVSDAIAAELIAAGIGTCTPI